MSPIANMLIQLKNAQARGYAEAVLPFSKIKFDIAQILKNKNFISTVEKKKKKTKKTEFDVLAIGLKYDNGVGVINEIKMVSKPSRRIYSGKKGMKKVKDGYGILIVSTSKGVMSGEDAKKAGLGGEVLFEIW
ncbi:MAG: 30S ribosomal protein S8 [Candidatus Yanofskybacteria bacterium]|nr:30S ribosomal protein S8 [Candidatus Yanofskybacteria bacterium]